MTGVIYHRPAARRDLIENYVYLADEAGEDIAERFLKNAEASFAHLAVHPLIGAPLHSQHPLLAGMRKWHVEGFDDILIFYMPRGNDVSIVRVLRAARDWWNLLDLS